MIKYALIDWYTGFPERSLYTRLLEDALDSPLTLTRNPADAGIVLIGSHGHTHKTPEFQRLRKPWKLQIIGEPINADFRAVHHSLSFDPLTYEGRNHRFPIWLWECHWYDDVPSTLSREETEEVFTTNRPLARYRATLADRKRRVIAVFNNREKRRLAVFNALHRRGIVDGVGTPFGDSGGHDYRHKCERIAGYVMNQCLENCFYHGYYTEKVLHARVFGCIPLTWSDADVSMDFDPRGLLNIRDCRTLDEIVGRVTATLADEAAISALVDQPILASIPSLDPVKEFLALGHAAFASHSIPDVGDAIINNDARPAVGGSRLAKMYDFASHSLHKVRTSLVSLCSRRSGLRTRHTR